jgi:hypothetical protein
VKNPNETTKRDDADDVTRRFILSIVLPAWSFAGLMDWYWHRLTKIERTAGAHESLTHLLMAAEGGVGALAPLVFEVDSGVVALTWAAAIVHEATVVWDVGYAKSRRRITQYEQHTHSFMEVLPFVNAAFVTLMHPEAALGVVGLGRPRRRLTLRLRRVTGGAKALAVITACGMVGVLPHIEEFVRCWRARPTLAPQPTHREDEPGRRR